MTQSFSPLADSRYPGFAVKCWHFVDGFGLRVLVKENCLVVVAAGPDAPWIELLIAISGKPWSDVDDIYEEGWFYAERSDHVWSFSSLGIRGTFSIPHAGLLRVIAVILALQRGQVPEIGEVLDADEWDRRFGWAGESGLLESHVESLNGLAKRYIEALKREGIVPGQSASDEVLQAREEIVNALHREGVTHREQPDAIFYQLRDLKADDLKMVLDALDMQFQSTQRCGTHRVALDWWILEPEHPRNGFFGALDFVQECHRHFERAHIVDLDPITFDVLGPRMYLLVGRNRRDWELRGAISEQTFLEIWLRRAQRACAERGYVLEKPLTRKVDEAHWPMVLRVFLELIGNGGRMGYLRLLSYEEIIAGENRESFLRPCPAEILDAKEMVDWEHSELPDGLLCVSDYYYNASRACLLADGRVVWGTPSETGFYFDPPSLWLWDSI